MDKKMMTAYETIEVQIGDVVLTDIEQQSVEMRELKDFEWYRMHFDLRRGDVVAFRRIAVTAEIETHREFRYGFDGAKRECCTSKTQRTLSEETLKLWHTRKRGWYWISLGGNNNDD